MGVPEPGEEHPGRGETERVDELSPEQAERDGIEQKDTLSAKGDHAALRGEVKEFVDIEVSGAHEDPPGPPITLRVKDISVIAHTALDTNLQPVSH
jgi:hypothetical protein